MRGNLIDEYLFDEKIKAEKKVESNGQVNHKFLKEQNKN